MKNILVVKWFLLRFILFPKKKIFDVSLTSFKDRSYFSMSNVFKSLFNFVVYVVVRTIFKFYVIFSKTMCFTGTVLLVKFVLRFSNENLRSGKEFFFLSYDIISFRFSNLKRNFLVSIKSCFANFESIMWIIGEKEDAI